MEVSKKVVIAGYFGVGKTSLIKRFIHEKFSDQYITTIGVKIDKKEVEVNGVKVNLILWDVAGEQSSLKIPKNYFAGAHGLIYVFDLTREETYENLETDVLEIVKDNPNIASLILGNKADLLDEEALKEVTEEISSSFKVTSAKTGDNVEQTFKTLAEALL